MLDRRVPEQHYCTKFPIGRAVLGRPPFFWPTLLTGCSELYEDALSTETRHGSICFGIHRCSAASPRKARAALLRSVAFLLPWQLFEVSLRQERLMEFIRSTGRPGISRTGVEGAVCMNQKESGNVFYVRTVGRIQYSPQVKVL